MIKIAAWIACEQNRPTGLASALNAQFVFLGKSAFKLCCTKKISVKSCYQSQYATFVVRFFLIAPRVWPPQPARTRGAQMRFPWVLVGLMGMGKGWGNAWVSYGTQVSFPQK